MSKKQVDNTVPRKIEPGACTWCGHTPHDGACPSSIRTDTKTESPCPCSRRTEGTQP